MSQPADNGYLDHLARKTEAAQIITGVLARYGIEMVVDRNFIHLRPSYISEYTCNQAKISNAIFDRMFPVEPAGEFFHYTSADGVVGILNERTLRLYSLEKWLRKDAGELDTFAKKHGLDGYLDDTEGRPYLEDLAKNLFFISLTRVDAANSEVMWRDFAGEQGARLRLRVSVETSNGHRGDLRGIHYETGKNTLLNEINEALDAAMFPPFIAWTISRKGAFYLPSDFSVERETRLLFKHFPEAPDKRRKIGRFHCWPVPLNARNEVATVDLVSIELGANCDRGKIERALKKSRLSALII